MAYVRQREWNCACGYTLLLQSTAAGDRLYDGVDQIAACPRCHRDLLTLGPRALEVGACLVLLDLARAGQQLHPDEHTRLARGLGVDADVLTELLAARTPTPT